MNQIHDDSLLRKLIGHCIETVTFWQYGYNLNTSLQNFPIQIEGHSYVRDVAGVEAAITWYGGTDQPFWVDPINLVQLIEEEIVATRLADDRWGCEIEFKSGAFLVIRTDSPYEDLHLGGSHF